MTAEPTLCRVWQTLSLGDVSIDKEMKVSHGVLWVSDVLPTVANCWCPQGFATLSIDQFAICWLNKQSCCTAGAAMLAEGLADLKEAESSGNLEGVVEDLLQGAGVDTADQAGAIAKGLRVFNPLGLANPRAVVSTTAGNFTAEIFLDQMPLTSSNFVDLASSGFYDGTHIHRVIIMAL